jgi:hypothetical protein
MKLKLEQSLDSQDIAVENYLQQRDGAGQQVDLGDGEINITKTVRRFLLKPNVMQIACK